MEVFPQERQGQPSSQKLSHGQAVSAGIGLPGEHLLQVGPVWQGCQILHQEWPLLRDRLHEVSTGESGNLAHRIPQPRA